MQLRKLSPRLHTLAKVSGRLIEQQAVSHVVDTCCDHGYLGLHLLHAHPCINLGFVDVLPHLCGGVEQSLRRLSMPANRATVLCKDASLLRLDLDLNITAPAQVLIVVAGVGGDICIRIIRGLLEQHAACTGLTLSFLVCPSNNMFRVRQTLQQERLSFEEEGFTADRGRAYEYLLLSAQGVTDCTLETDNKLIPDIGDFWQLLEAGNIEQRRYIQRLLLHYRRQHQGMLDGKSFNDAQEREVMKAIHLYSQLIEQAT